MLGSYVPASTHKGRRLKKSDTPSAEDVAYLTEYSRRYPDDPKTIELLRKHDFYYRKHDTEAGNINGNETALDMVYFFVHKLKYCQEPRWVLPGGLPPMNDIIDTLVDLYKNPPPLIQKDEELMREFLSGEIPREKKCDLYRNYTIGDEQKYERFKAMYLDILSKVREELKQAEPKAPKKQAEPKATKSAKAPTRLMGEIQVIRERYTNLIEEIDQHLRAYPSNLPKKFKNLTEEGIKERYFTVNPMGQSYARRLKTLEDEFDSLVKQLQDKGITYRKPILYNENRERAIEDAQRVKDEAKRKRDAMLKAKASAKRDEPTEPTLDDFLDEPEPARLPSMDFPMPSPPTTLSVYIDTGANNFTEPEEVLPKESPVRSFGSKPAPRKIILEEPDEPPKPRAKVAPRKIILEEPDEPLPSLRVRVFAYLDEADLTKVTTKKIKADLGLPNTKVMSNQILELFREYTQPDEPPAKAPRAPRAPKAPRARAPRGQAKPKSECSKKPEAECLPPTCKYAKGAKRQFCRKATNKKKIKQN
jgi:hypothetical protein